MIIVEAASILPPPPRKRKSMRQGPLAGRYPAAAAMVMFALIPYLALSAAIGPVTPIIGRDLHMSPQAMSLGSGMANAAYAVGHGAGRPVRPAAAPAADDARLRRRCS